MAIFGWPASKLVQRYAKSAQSKRILDAGFERGITYVARKNVPLLRDRNSGETHLEENNTKKQKW